MISNEGNGDRDLRLLDWEMVGECAASKMESSDLVHFFRRGLIRCFSFFFLSINQT